MSTSLRWLIQRVVGSVSIFPFRIVAFLFHATGLERVYKPRFTRHAALLEIDDAFIAGIPTHCRTITGAESDPINLIFIGDEKAIIKTFRNAGWHRANPASPVHLTYGLLSAVFKRSYKTGPFAPLYINIGLQDLAFQRSDNRSSFRERHHLRMWRTGTTLSDGQPVWLCAAGHEDGMKFTTAIPFYTHVLDPDLDTEREYVLDSLVKQGVVRLKYVNLNTNISITTPKKSVFGSLYYTDGRAAIAEVPRGI